MIVSPQKASELIRKGELVALPTETVYGLAADAFNAVAVRKTFELKNRPSANPLIVHISEISQLGMFTGHRSDSETLLKLTEAFWPGPLTLVVPRKKKVLDIVTGGLETVAIRMPDHPKTLSVIQNSMPVTAPSANRSGRPSPTKVQHVLEDFGETLPVVDGGDCAIGLESTVVDITNDNPVILRPGKISPEMLSDILGVEVGIQSKKSSTSARSPGTRYTHYKPDAEVRWMKRRQPDIYNENTFQVYHTITPEDPGPNSIHFHGDFDEMARALYDLYRTADRKNLQTIFIEPLPEHHPHPLLPALQNRIQHSVNQ